MNCYRNVEVISQEEEETAELEYEHLEFPQTV